MSHPRRIETFGLCHKYIYEGEGPRFYINQVTLVQTNQQ